MSWLSQAFHGDTTAIAKIGGVVAAPFTGGSSLAITTAAMKAESAEKAAQDQANADAAAAAQIAAQNAAATQSAAGQRNVKDLAQFSRNPGDAPRESSGSSFGMTLPLILGAMFLFLLFFVKGR